MRRLFLLPFALSSLLAVAIAAPVNAAGAPQSISMSFCAGPGGGAMTVKASKETFVMYGWTANTTKQVKNFVNNTKVKFKIDGVRLAHATDYWQGDIVDGPFPGDRTEFWVYEMPSVSAGTTLHMTLNFILLKPNFDGVYHYPAGKLYDPALACDVTFK